MGDIVGELVIVQNQVNRLRTKLAEKGAGYSHKVAGYYYSTKKTGSSHTFECNGKWYRVSVKIDKMIFPLDGPNAKTINDLLDPSKIFGNLFKPDLEK